MSSSLILASGPYTLATRPRGYFCQVLHLKCPFCASDKALEVTTFGSRGKVAVCSSCYNNPMLRKQIVDRFRTLFDAVSSGSGSDSAKEEILALAARYKLPRPEIY